jgi:transposase
LFKTESASALPRFVERQLEAIEQLTVQVQEADAELRELAERDPICRRSMTLDGVGPVTAVRYAAAIDDVSRFPDAHAVASYLGLTPGEDSSSDRRRRTGITKAGAPALRRTLLQAAWAARRCRRRGPLQQWADEVEKRRGPHVATTALARKMVGILYAMWRDGQDFNPQRAARSPVAQPRPLENQVPERTAVDAVACGRSQGQAASGQKAASGRR